MIHLLSAAGTIVDAYLPADRETGRPRGFAFVTFATEAEAGEAIRQFHDREVNGRKLVVNPAEGRPSHEGDRPSRARSFKRKGSRRGLRGRKRSL